MFIRSLERLQWKHLLRLAISRKDALLDNTIAEQLVELLLHEVLV